ncbi:hypothetical protein [Clostridium estertheticum]|uniref:hypothetical protein n=1 Tax=Clostridium estertheticum TaxID=238834 RepID=UPI001CF4A35F|nr:hypothetical protein [Clostridium estertheticum]MCB2340123.1 hypothetical protein [Clostridium estertheticum]
MENNNSQVQNGDINNQPMTFKDWILTDLLLLIPIANLVLMFVWAFGKDVNKSKKAFFQAQLIMCAIGLVIYIIFFATIIASIIASTMNRGY